MKLKTLSASVALALGMTVGLGLSGTAEAGPTFFGSAGTLFEDDLLDYLIDRNGNGLIDVGDSIVAVFSVAATAPVNPAGPSVPIAPPEFSGVIDQFVIAKVSLGGGLYNFIFGANPGGFLDLDLNPLTTGAAGDYIGGAAGQTAAAGAPASTLLRFWDGPIADLDLAGADCNTGVAGSQAALTTCLTAASNGTLFWNAGFTGAGGLPAGNEHLIVANASDNPLTVLGIASTSAVGTPGFAFQQFAGGIGPDVAPMLCNALFCPVFNSPVLLVDAKGSGTIQGGQGLPTVGAAYVNGVDPFARGDFQFEVLTLVPEPGSLALLGLGLAGLGAAVRRRKYFV